MVGFDSTDGTSHCTPGRRLHRWGAEKDAILASFEKRLQNSPAQEIETALEEIFKIAELRLRDLTEP